MFQSKKSVEIAFNTIVIAAICLIVLVVIIAVFRGQISNVAQGFTRISEREADESALENIFGCNEGSTACRSNSVYVCRNSEWVKERDCSGRCEEDSACT